MKPAPIIAPCTLHSAYPSQLIADNTLLFDSKTLPGPAHYTINIITSGISIIINVPYSDSFDNYVPCV